jgi:hypothetical protein
MASVAVAATMGMISSHENTTIRFLFFYLSPLFGGSHSDFLRDQQCAP